MSEEQDSSARRLRSRIVRPTNSPYSNPNFDKSQHLSATKMPLGRTPPKTKDPPGKERNIQSSGSPPKSQGTAVASNTTSTVKVTGTKPKIPLINIPIVEDKGAKQKQAEAKGINETLANLEAGDRTVNLGTANYSSMEDLLSHSNRSTVTNKSPGDQMNDPMLINELQKCKEMIRSLNLQIQSLQKTKEVNPPMRTRNTYTYSANSYEFPQNNRQDFSHPEEQFYEDRQIPTRTHPDRVRFKDNENRDSESEGSQESQRSVRRFRPQYIKCEMDRWPIKFSGGNGLKFWKKIDKLQRSYDYEDYIVFKYFHLLLEGHAMEWYWQFSDEYPNSNLNHLKAEFLRVFKPTETDMSLISTMYTRKQGRDSFDKFYNDIVEKNFSLKEPLSDEQIIEILRTNMDDEVRQRIFTFETRDRIKFYHKAKKAYDDACQVREKRRPFGGDYKVNRKINELDFEDLSTPEIEEITAKIQNWKVRRSKLQCFNCKSEDHLLAKCPDDISRLFCFRCGLEGYASPKCPNCALNRHGGAN